jgi:hypothetical protein
MVLKVSSAHARVVISRQTVISRQYRFLLASSWSMMTRIALITRTSQVDLSQDLT